MRQNKNNKKFVGTNTTSDIYAKRVILESVTLKDKDHTEYRYKPDTNTLIITDAFGSTYYHPKIIDSNTVIPFYERIKPVGY